MKQELLLVVVASLLLSTSAQAGGTKIDLARILGGQPSNSCVAPVKQTLIDAQVAASCCKICSKGKACGNSCISRSKQCHQPRGCACDAQ